jgi:predicted ATPase
MSPQFILTGAPGSGKTTVIGELRRRGLAVVQEAATDVIADFTARGVALPHLEADFLEAIVSLQDRRRRAVAGAPGPVFHDRSPICTLALAEFLERQPPPALIAALEAIDRGAFYARQVYFLRNLGFIVNTAARRISFEDTLRFETVHEDVYRRLGYELVFIDAAAAPDRAGQIADLSL